MSFETSSNPLIDRYAWVDPADRLPSDRLVDAMLVTLLDELKDVIPEVEIPRISSVLGTINDRDSDPVTIESPSVTYQLPDGKTTNIMLSVQRPRVLHALDLDATEWSKLSLHVGPPAVAWISKAWGFEVKNPRSVVRGGTIRELGQFVSACHFVKRQLG